MKILIVLPNWLGDAIMCTPAIELLAKYYQNIELTLVGSYVSIEALNHLPLCIRAIVDETKNVLIDLLLLINLPKNLVNSF